MTPAPSGRIAAGIGWAAGLRLGDRLIGLASIAVLARLLLPADFGLVAYAMTFYGLLEAFFQFGFETVLIRDRERSRERYDTAWTLGVIKGVVVCVLLFLAARPVADFFEEPRVEGIVGLVALLPLLRGLENVGVVDFQRNLAFDREFRFLFGVRLGTVTLTIALAALLRSHWALVYGMVAGTLGRTVSSYFVSDYRPRFELRQFAAIFSFSKWILVQSVFTALQERLPALVIGRFQNPQSLAHYTMSAELANFASIELSAPIRRVLLPGIARLAADRDEMLRTLRLAIAIVVLVGLPATIGMGLVAPMFVPLFLGENWTPVAPVLQVLAVNAVVYVVLYSNSNVIYLVLGRPAITARLEGLRVMMLLPLLLLTVPDNGAMSAAWALVVANSLYMILDYAAVLHIVPLGLRSILAAVWRSIVATCIMAGAVLLVQGFLSAMPGLVLALEFGACIVTGSIVYFVAILALWWAAGRPDGAEAYLGRLVSQGGRWLYERRTVG